MKWVKIGRSKIRSISPIDTILTDTGNLYPVERCQSLSYQGRLELMGWRVHSKKDYPDLTVTTWLSPDTVAFELPS